LDETRLFGRSVVVGCLFGSLFQTEEVYLFFIGVTDFDIQAPKL
jgi:hypothetical protein